MRSGLLIGTVAAIGAVPCAVLLLLIATGAAAAGPALLGLAAVLVAAAGLGLIWVWDMERLAETLRHAVMENSLALSHAAGAPRLPPIERVTRAIERLARTLAARAAQVEHLLHATETIVERLPDPLLVLGPDRLVRRANEAARAAFGGEISAVLRHPGLRAAIDRAFTQGTAETAELTLRVPVPREVQASVLPMDPPLADGGRAIVVLSDRTRERVVERTRADFVANASHELRTPLSSLIGFIDTLRGPAADDAPAQRRFLAIMAEQAERMNRLIDDLLSLSRIELTEHQPPNERVDVVELTHRIAAAFEPRVAAREVDLDLDLAKGLPLVTADADQLEQVLQNLVDNAVKYGPQGGRVRVVAKLPQPSGRWPSRPGVVISVSDEGPGIPKEHVPRLTERFYRVDKGRSRSAGGTGLGLAIVKHIVNRHRGQLVIESEEGKGSTFSVWLPVAAERETAR
jgi:two-component system, OmpR family, phosphate regulon sensor histidine kinase PhoR